MKKAAMNRRKRLDAPSKQESRERYETARRQNTRKDEKSNSEDILTSTTELLKRPREDTDKDDKSSDLRDKIPKLSRTIAGNEETGSLVVNIGKTGGASTLSLVDPSYGDRTSVEMFNYSHGRTETAPVDDDDLRSLIERQRKSEKLIESDSKKEDKHSKKGGAIFFDSMLAYGKEHSKDKASGDFRDAKRKDSKKSLSKNDKYSKSEKKSDEWKHKGKKEETPSGFELGIPFFSGSVGGSKASATPAEEMDINETLKELAYLRSIQTGDNALPKEEEEYFRQLNDLSKSSVTSQLDLIMTGKDGKKKRTSTEKLENLGQSESKWDKLIDSMVGSESTMTAGEEETTYGPSLPPKKSSSTSKKVSQSHSSERSSKEKSSSRSKSERKSSPLSASFRGGRGGYRGRGFRGSFRGRGRGRGRGFKDLADSTRGRGGRGSIRGVRGGFLPTRGRHIFAKESTSGRRSRSRSSSRSSFGSRSRSRSRGRSRNKRRRHRSSSRSNYTSSSSRSRSRSRDRSRGKRQTKLRHRSSSYSSRSRSRSRSHSRSRGQYKRRSKDQRRSKSSSSSRSRSRKRKERSRSWSFDEDYTKKKDAKGIPESSAAKTNKVKDKPKKEQETKALPKAKKETEKESAKPKNDKKQLDSKQIPNNQGKTKTPGKFTEYSAEKTSKEKLKSEGPVSPAVVALKELKVTAFSNVFLPRTVSRTVGNITKGMPLPKGRNLPIKTHPMFDAPEEDIKEETVKTDSKVNKEEKNRFDEEVDKVFNAKPLSKEKEKKAKGSWTRVWPDSPKKEDKPVESKEEYKVEVKDTKDKGAEKKVFEDQTVVDTKDLSDEKSEKEQKKEKREKKRKEKEEKSKKKKEKKEKKEKNSKETAKQETLGNENEEKIFENNEGQVALDSMKSEQLNQEGFEGSAYVDYSESYQDYPEGEYQCYDESGQEQGWYDENGVYHEYQEEEYYYYYDQEGNIVGYDGPEGYVEGNPFEAEENPAEGGYVYDKEQQEYYYQEDQQEGQPEVYNEAELGAQYAGDVGEGNYQQGAQQEAYDYPVGAQGAEGEMYGDGSQWEGYAAETQEQQWYGPEGSYTEGEYQYTETQEEHQYPTADEQGDPGLHDADFMAQQGGLSYGGPGTNVEEPKSKERELVALLGQNLAELAKLKGWDQQELLGKDPILLSQLLLKPLDKSLSEGIERESQPEELKSEFQQEREHIETMRHYRREQETGDVKRQYQQGRESSEAKRQYPQEREPVEAQRQYQQEQETEAKRKYPQERQKPLKSILKKGNNVSLKPPPKSETSSITSILTKSDPASTTSSDHVGPEYIVCISKTGPERFFCKLCQCHIESPMAKELHVKSMKHIELFVREKSSLLYSVIGSPQTEEQGKPKGEVLKEQFIETVERKETIQQNTTDKRDYHHERRERGSGFQNKGKKEDTPEEVADRNRLLDYDRLRLRDWHLREGSSSSLGSERLGPLDYGRTDEHRYENKPDKIEKADRVRGNEPTKFDDRREQEKLRQSEVKGRSQGRLADGRQDEPQRYERERHSAEDRQRGYNRLPEKADRERRSSHDSDRRDDGEMHGSVGSRSSARSLDGSEKDSRFMYQDSHEHRATYKDRMEQDGRSSSREPEFRNNPQRGQPERLLNRPGVNQGERSKNQDKERERTYKEGPSKQEQLSGRARGDRPKQDLREKEKVCEDNSRSLKPPGQGRGEFSYRENRSQTQRSWHRQNCGQGDVTGQDPIQTNRLSDLKTKEPSPAQKESSRNDRTSLAERKEPARSESADNARGRMNQNIKSSGKVSHSASAMENNRSQQSQNNDTKEKEKINRGYNERPPGLQMAQRKQKEMPAQKQRVQELAQRNAKTSSGSLLGEPPIQLKQKDQPQEIVQSISTVIQGQRRVPPPPPPYNKGSGPQSFRGRGNPQQFSSRGGYRPQMPPSQPGMMMANNTPPQSLLSMPVSGAASVGGVPPREPYPGGRGVGDHPDRPFFGGGRAASQPQFHQNRGGNSNRSRGGRGGPQQFQTRGRGMRGFRGQRW